MFIQILLYARHRGHKDKSDTAPILKELTGQGDMDR